MNLTKDTNLIYKYPALLTINIIIALLTFYQLHPITYYPGDDRVYVSLMLEYAPCIKETIFCFMEPHEIYTKPLFIWLSTITYLTIGNILKLSALESMVILSQISMAIIATIMQIQVIRSVKDNKFTALIVAFILFWTSATVWGADTTQGYAQINAAILLITLEIFFQYSFLKSKKSILLNFGANIAFMVLVAFLSVFAIFLHIGSLPYVMVILFLGFFLLFLPNCKVKINPKVKSRVLNLIKLTLIKILAITLILTISFVLFYFLLGELYIGSIYNLFIKNSGVADLFRNHRILIPFFLVSTFFLGFLILFLKKSQFNISIQDRLRIITSLKVALAKISIVTSLIIIQVLLIYFYLNNGKEYIDIFYANSIQNYKNAAVFVNDIRLVGWLYSSILFYFIFAEWPTIILLLTAPIVLSRIKLKKKFLTSSGNTTVIMYAAFFIISFLGLSFASTTKLLRLFYPTYIPFLFLSVILVLYFIQYGFQNRIKTARQYIILGVITFYLLITGFNAFRIISCTMSYKNGLPKFLASHINSNLIKSDFISYPSTVNGSMIFELVDDKTFFVSTANFLHYYTGFLDHSTSLVSFNDLISKANEGDHLITDIKVQDLPDDGWVIIDEYTYRDCQCNYAHIWANEFVTMKYLISGLSNIDKHSNNKDFIFRLGLETIHKEKKLYLYEMREI